MKTETINQIGLGVAVLIWLVIAIFCGIVGDDITEKVVSASLLILGTLLGVLLGFLLSPEEDEMKNFETYSKYILTLISGYLASKFDTALNQIITGISQDEVVGFRLVAFLAAMILGLISTFVVRRYPL